jgi:hypothetical protein
MREKAQRVRSAIHGTQTNGSRQGHAPQTKTAGSREPAVSCHWGLGAFSWTSCYFPGLRSTLTSESDLQPEIST